ncbi:MAG: hypothetical protein ACLQD9_05020 [Thermoplasmata archaeon]
MTNPFRWTFPILAIGATFVAIQAGSNEFVSVPLATIAVAAAGLALWDSVRSPPPEMLYPSYVEDGTPVGSSDVWFRSGTMSQESIVILLDRIDRALVRPSLPTRTPRELEQLSNLPWERFLEYVESRLAQLEANS